MQIENLLKDEYGTYSAVIYSYDELNFMGINPYSLAEDGKLTTLIQDAINLAIYSGVKIKKSMGVSASIKINPIDYSLMVAIYNYQPLNETCVNCKNPCPHRQIDKEIVGEFGNFDDMISAARCLKIIQRKKSSYYKFKGKHYLAISPADKKKNIAVEGIIEEFGQVAEYHTLILEEQGETIIKDGAIEKLEVVF